MKIRVVMMSLLALATVAGLTAFSPVDPQATNTQVTNTQATETYKVDPVHTTAIFRVKHLGVTYFYGRFNETTGSFTLNTENPSEMSFDVQIKTDSVDTNAARRNNHLKSPDFFNAKEFPTISFKSKSVQSSGENMYTVSGDLMLHGVTKPITVQMEFVGQGDKGPRFGYRAGFDVTFTIKRSDFGMSYMQGMLGDEVTIMVGLEGARQ